ncbi:hypothetical protein TEA_028651 [Camellia sinensis var. sinensis]|uniref:F-box domain-containing protein n=1 Tax=Camellia sinensis var. sinensis TaxID=542762 RepID=A0A4S4EZM6_CAMSN|nr:hypothetical protein TEA_028651 [Camellia sinensis var. sinensis]
MVKGKERERETEDEEETERFDEYCYSMSKNGELYKGCWVSSGSPSLEKMKTCKTTMGTGPNWLGFSSCDGSDDGTSGTEPQDADYSYIPSLDYELESQILARIPRSEYWKLCLVNRRCLTLLKSGELFKIRRELGVRESSVLMAPIGENSWWAYDKEFKTRRKLPNLQTDFCFVSGDKESFCAGTHLLVSGRESLGNELLVIGAPSDSGAGNCMAIYTCCPDLDANELRWRLVNRNRNQIGHFILNCSVMVA